MRYLGTLLVALSYALPQRATADALTACPPIELAGVEAQGVNVASAQGAWGGPRRGDEGTLSDRVVQYEIDAVLDPIKHSLVGKQKLTWRNRSAQNVCAVYLHLYLNAFEGPGSTFMTEKRSRGSQFRSGVGIEDGEWGFIDVKRIAQDGSPLKWEFVQPDGGPRTDRSVVRVDLGKPAAPGASIALDIDFFDQLPRVTARTGYFGSFHLLAQWFPKIAVLELPGERGATRPRWNAHEFHLHSEFYADFGSFDVRLTVPKGYVVGATGEERGAPLQHSGTTTHRFVQDDVHDFAWTADDRYKKPLVHTYRGAGSPAVEVRVLYPPEYAHNAKPVLEATLDSLKYFSETLGPYPYRTVTAVIPPYNADEAGGMEYPTFFTAGSFAQVAPDTPERFGLDFVTIHEFGHGYFYGILASNEFEEPMLDEGINQYWNQRMLRERQQRLHITTPLLKSLGFDPTLGPAQLGRFGANLDDPADPLGQNSWDRLSSSSYGSVYSRTATAMHDLEARVGKAAIERAFKLYYERWKFRHPSLADFRDALIEGTGQRKAVEQIFAEHIYAAHEVNDRIERFTSVEELPEPGYSHQAGRRVEKRQEVIEKRIAQEREKWSAKHPDANVFEGPFPYRTTVVVRRAKAKPPQTLRVRFADGSTEVVAVDTARSWQRFSWSKAARAISAELDPQGKIALDSNKLDDSKTLDPDVSPARRWALEFATLLQVLLLLLVSL